jgi:uncharacterized protein YndB with AHSA1/START domain
MADNDTTTTVNRPVEEVFNLISDIPNYSQWVTPNSPFFIESKVSPAGPVGLGTKYEDKLHFGKNIGQVIEYQPYEKLVLEQKWYPETHIWKTRIEYLFEPVNGSTSLTRRFEMTPIEGFQPMSASATEMIREESIRTCKAVKVTLEGGS